MKKLFYLVALTGLLFGCGKSNEDGPAKQVVELPPAAPNRILYTSSDKIIFDKEAFGTPLMANLRNGTNGVLEFEGEVKTIGINAFRNCKTLTGISLPQGVEIVGDSAFFNCTALKKITMPDNVKKIGKMAFAKSSIDDITLPKGLDSLKEWSFWECTNLKNIVIPDKVKLIEQYFQRLRKYHNHQSGQCQ